jgi:beta-lactamase class D
MKVWVVYIKKILKPILITMFAVFYSALNITNVNAEAKSNKKTSTEDLSKYFKGYDGCFVMFDQAKDKYTIYNREKINKRISPCSTFKMYISLIGLETGVLKDENTKFKWDGTKYFIDAWNKDQTLASAICNSVNWYYDKVSAKVGKANMKKWIDKMNYGNKDMMGKSHKGEDYLPMSLKISPMEQIDLLKKMYSYKLPFKKHIIDILKKIIVVTKNQDAVLSGKTGSGVSDGKASSGWFVGYVQKNKNIDFFALNIESGENPNGMKAKEIALRILKAKKLI